MSRVIHHAREHTRAWVRMPSGKRLDLLDPTPFDWDDGDPYVFAHPSDRRRHVALGFVPDERFVLVVFEYDAEKRWVESGDCL